VGLALVEGSESVLVTAARKAAADGGEVSWVVWAVEGDSMSRVDASGQRPEGCIRRSESAALCLLRSKAGRLSAGVLDFSDRTLRAQQSVGPGFVEIVNGAVATESGGLLAWGMSELRPFATLVDGDGKEKWTVRWAEFGETGEFYDGLSLGEGSRLLARSRREDGSQGERFAELEIGSQGGLAAVRRFSHSGGRTLPLLVKPVPDRAPADSLETGEDARASAQSVLLEGGLGVRLGLLKWWRLDGETIAHLSVEGTTTVLVVNKPATAAVARAPVKGLPFSALLVGRAGTIYVLTMDVETSTPPRQVLRLTRLELSG
jgi:hypothetical protein